MSAVPDGTNGRHPLPSPEAMTQTFGRLGIGPGTQAVLYDQDDGRYASRLWWMLRYMGHQAAAVLDGGWAKWTREGRPTRGGEETRSARGVRGRRRNRAPACAWTRWRGSSEVPARCWSTRARRNVSRDGTRRSIAPPAIFPGRPTISTSGTWAPTARCSRRSSSGRSSKQLLGGRRPEQVVMYCGSGVTACQNLLAMEHAGLRGARIYPGSWSEWSSDSGAADCKRTQALQTLKARGTRLNVDAITNVFA